MQGNCVVGGLANCSGARYARAMTNATLPTKKVLIGRITTTPGARYHLAFSGSTPCSSGATAPLHHPVATYRGIDLGLLCRRCFTPANLTRAQAEVTSGGRFNAALDQFLCDARGIVGYGPDTVDAKTARPASAKAAATTAAVPAPPRPAFLRFQQRQAEQAQARTLGAWGQLAAKFAVTHPSTARIAA